MRQRQHEAEAKQARAWGDEANNYGLAGFNSNSSPVMREDYVADREVLKVRQDLAEEQFGTREQQWQ